jgi:prophage regulatory protein
MLAQTLKPRKFLRLRTVAELTGHKRSSIYAAIKQGNFPKQIKLGPKAVAWDADEIAAWQNAKIDARDAALIR